MKQLGNKPFIKIIPQHLPVEHSGVEYKLGNFLRVVQKNTSEHEVTDTLNERTHKKQGVGIRVKSERGGELFCQTPRFSPEQGYHMSFKWTAKALLI